MKTIAIVIGISHYQDEKFSELPGAEADSKRFASALVSWGLPREWVFHLSREKATRANVIKTFFDSRSLFDAEAKLLFYFAGHGIRENDRLQDNHLESSLVLYDTKSNDPLPSSLRLVELLQLVNMLRPLQTFLFIDACNLRINHLHYPLQDDMTFSSQPRGFFCMLSSGIKPSYEDGVLKYGYFSASVLKAMGELRHLKTATCHDIFLKVQQESALLNLPMPEVYHIGSLQMWPLAPYYKKEESKLTSELVIRKEALAKLQDYLVTAPDPLIWMWGEGGLGKTILAKQLSQAHSSVVYLSIVALASTPKGLILSLIEQVRAQKSELFFNRPTERELSLCLKHIQENHPHTILIIDHLDRPSSQDVNAIVNEIDLISLPTILISRYPCSIHLFSHRKSKLLSWRASSLNEKEIAYLLEINQLETSYKHALLTATNGNALKVRKMLVKLSSTQISFEDGISEEYEKSIKAIAATGGFLDEMIFCKVFKLNSKVLDTLEKLGLIHYTKKGCLPHDFLLEMIEENNWAIDVMKACHYWKLQIKHTPFNIWACSSLVLLASQLDDCKPFKRALCQCLKVLNEVEYVCFLHDLNAIFKKHAWEEALLEGTSYLMNRDEYALSVNNIRDLLNSSNPEIKKKAECLNIHLLVRLGKYEDALSIGSHFLKMNRSLTLQAAVRNNMGIAFFFLGRLPEAMAAFQKNLASKNKMDEIENGLTHYLIGQLMTYWGEDLVKAKKWILNGIHILEQSKDYKYLIIALTALADHAYYQAHWRQALHYLNRAQEIADALRNKMLSLFPARSTVRLHLRMYGPESEELLTSASNLECLLCENLKEGHNLVTFWAQNTLATVYAYRKDIYKVQMLIEELAPLTNGFQCNIYTLSNLGHLAFLKGDETLAQNYYKQASDLAKNLKNQIFLQEIEQDQKYISSLFTLQSSTQSALMSA